MESKYDFLPYASAITLLLIFVFLQDRDGISPLEMGLFTVILFILVRQLLMTADNGKLLVRLRDKNEELGKSEERYRELVEISPSAVTVIQEGNMVYVNKAGLKLFGAASLDDIANMPLLEIIHKDHWDQILLRSQLARENGNATKPTEYKVNRLDGRTIYIESAVTTFNYNGKSALLSVAQDITARKLADEKIQRLAYNDLLTGLPNRARLHDRLSEQLAAAGHNGARLGVLFIDLDRFKFINDSLGHNIGDLFLWQVSERLTSILGLNSVLYRHGGDEFCVIAEVEGREEAREIAEQIIEGLSAPFLLNQRELFYVSQHRHQRVPGRRGGSGNPGHVRRYRDVQCQAGRGQLLSILRFGPGRRQRKQTEYRK
ncbi:diguanylate cyclase [Cohnella ginsengisoli]|uniref:Diguanylate cyclase n=1 Tax=Cohnella ginsengisoli TaxID=425004 RepID=A0A9X4QQN2_9BACL|nr:diguanylate cyclase [Cohnella ginsengisoli]MDG0795108.1 diguanylate cyclase [Cohnella ginsengisoli]